MGPDREAALQPAALAKAAEERGVELQRALDIRGAIAAFEVTRAGGHPQRIPQSLLAARYAAAAATLGRLWRVLEDLHLSSTRYTSASE